MRTPASLVAALAALLCSCTPEPKVAVQESPKKADAPKPHDETRRFPMANMLTTEVVGNQLLGKPFMPGGTLAHYKKGKTEYDMFVAKLPTATDAAILLSDWNKALTGSKLVPSFGGYFGRDAGRTVFVFSKNAWIAGIVGLPQAQADLEARTLAGHLN